MSLDLMWRFEVGAERTEDFWVQRTMQPLTQTTHRSSKPRSARNVRAAGVLTLVGLTFGAVPTNVAASAVPTYLAGPLVQSVVGLGEGASGDTVRSLQNALMAAGVTVPGGADGIFGPKTKSAVIAYQSRQGLPATGQVDEATARALGLSEGAAASSSSALLSIGARATRSRSCRGP